MIVTVHRRKFCVYRHLLDGKVVYVGQGIASRPFELRGSNRGPLWNMAVGKRCSIEVEIVAWYDTQEEAVAAESAEIATLQPPGNSLGTAHGMEHRTATRRARKEQEIAGQQEYCAKQERQKRLKAMSRDKSALGARPLSDEEDPSFSRTFLESYHNVWGR